jgi:S-DNA-T family DNA segregation ATPase FtsK/SpoIIIE
VSRYSRPSSRRLRAQGVDPETVVPNTPDFPALRATPEDTVSEDNGDTPITTAATPPVQPHSDLPPRPEKRDPVDGLARPIVPDALNHPLEAAKAAALRAGRAVAFHGLRVPWYQLENLAWTPRGVARVVEGIWNAATDKESAPLRAVASQTNDIDRYLQLDIQRDRHVRRRFVPAVLAGVGVVGAVLLVLLGLMAPATRAEAFVLACGLSWVFGRKFGSPEDRPMFPSSVVAAPGAKRITDGMLLSAFLDAQLCTEDRPISFYAPVAQNYQAKGWDAGIVLPGNKTSEEAIKKRVKIAAGLDIDESRVFPERVRGDQGSARRVYLLVTNKDPLAAKPRPTPLLAVKQLDAWQPFQIGLRPNGVPAEMALVATNTLIGGMPGSGKTFTTRLFPAAAALDPTVQLRFADGKGGADLMPFERVAHWFVAGQRGAAVESLDKMLAGLQDEKERRYVVLQQLARRGLVRESKVNPGITRNPEYDMPLILVVIDEFHAYLEDPIYGSSIGGRILDLVRQGRAAGISFILTTQRPSAKTVSTDLRNIIGTRICHRVDGLTDAKMILGDTLPAGVEPWTIQRHQAGAFCAIGVDADTKAAQFGSMLVKGDYADDLAIAKIVGQGWQLRNQEGLLTGFAAGDGAIEEETPPELLGDIITVFRPGEKKAWSQTICDRLGDHKPMTYSGWTPHILQKNLAAFEVTTRDVWAKPDDGGEATTKKGVELEDVLRAHARLIPDSPEGLA